MLMLVDGGAGAVVIVTGCGDAGGGGDSGGVASLIGCDGGAHGSDTPQGLSYQEERGVNRKG